MIAIIRANYHPIITSNMVLLTLAKDQALIYEAKLISRACFNSVSLTSLGNDFYQGYRLKLT